MDGINNLKIADDVIIKIVGKSINEIEGVSPSLGNEIIGRLTNKSAFRGIKVDIDDNNVAVEASIVIDYGVKIADVTAQVQEKIAKNIEDMCGMNVTNVDIVVTGVNLEADAPSK